MNDIYYKINRRGEEEERGERRGVERGGSRAKRSACCVDIVKGVTVGVLFPEQGSKRPVKAGRCG
jgi:hypothetical protein